jgi:hypothetical protein
MIEEVGPAKLIYAADEEPIQHHRLPREVGPAKLRYTPDDDEIKQGDISPTNEQTPDKLTKAMTTDKPETKATDTGRKKPTPYYTIRSKAKVKKGRDIMAKKVMLKVEDLLRAGRSHFEIPKSQQEAMKAQKKAGKKRW